MATVGIKGLIKVPNSCACEPMVASHSLWTVANCGKYLSCSRECVLNELLHLACTYSVRESSWR